MSTMDIIGTVQIVIMLAAIIGGLFLSRKA